MPVILALEAGTGRCKFKPGLHYVSEFRVILCYSMRDPVLIFLALEKLKVVR